MTSLLRIDASARTTRSLTRALADRLETAWRATEPALEVIRRDVGQAPPPAIDEAWIAAAFAKPEARTPEQAARLALSDTLIDELTRAGTILIASPMYNYGMPAALKAWVDQVIRIGRTFTFDLARGDRPIEPILSGKRLVLLTSSGEFGFEPGGMNADHGHLVPHLRTVGRYLGVAETHEIAIEYQEFRDDRHARSVAEAHRAAEALGHRLARAAVPA